MDQSLLVQYASSCAEYAYFDYYRLLLSIYINNAANYYNYRHLDIVDQELRLNDKSHHRISCDNLAYVIFRAAEYVSNNPIPLASLAGGMSEEGDLKLAFLIHSLTSNRYLSFEATLKDLIEAMLNRQEKFSPNSMPVTLLWEEVANALCIIHWNEINRNAMFSAIEDRIISHLHEVCPGKYEEHQLEGLETWLSEDILIVARRLYPDHDDGGLNFIASLTFALHTHFVKLRGGELFDMVADFPSSLPGILDLRKALGGSSSSSSSSSSSGTSASPSTTDSRRRTSELAKSFRIALKKRLLHVGASTAQILDMYISMVRCLRVLDPSDIFLNFVTQPIRQYLLKRKDTIRRIVSSLTDSSKESELHGELKKGGSLEYGADSDDEEGRA